jgi:putative effector of murein hydrolase
VFESRYQNLIPIKKFIRRVAKHLLFSMVIIIGALILGILGYHYIAGFEWIDALLNASMILTGMGPIGQLTTTAGKIFASIYALFSGLVFVTVMAITIAPVLHRLLHIIHLDDEDLSE